MDPQTQATEPKKEETPAAPNTNSTPSSEPESFLADPPAPAAEPKKEETPASFSAPSEVEEIEYELELADDSLVPDEEFEALAAEAKEKGLTKEEAEARLKLLDSAYKNAKDTFVKSEGKRLMDELLSDPDFNTPEKQKEAKANIDRVYAAYKDPDFMKFVKGNPMVGNNKHFVKFLAKLGASLAPEGAPKGDGSTPATPPKQTGEATYQDLYPSMF